MSGIERVVPIHGRHDLTVARQAGRDLARELGLSLTDQTRTATAISELVRNVIQYAGSGECRVSGERSPTRLRLQVEVEDGGPGIADPEQAMRDGWSTSGGLGAGLPGTRRLVDEFLLETRPGRTLVRFALVRRVR